MTITIDDLVRRRYVAIVQQREKAEIYLQKKVIPWLAKRPLRSFRTCNHDVATAALQFGLTYGHSCYTYYIRIPERQLLKD